MHTSHVDSDPSVVPPITETQPWVVGHELNATTGSEEDDQDVGHQSALLVDQRLAADPRTTVQMAWIQGILYLVVGVWPLFDLASFTRLSSPAQPVWAMQANGIFVAGIGAYLISAALRGHIDVEACALGLGCALALGIIDGAYIVTGHHTPYYLFDITIQVILAGAWWYSRRAAPERSLTRRDAHGSLH